MKVGNTFKRHQRNWLWQNWVELDSASSP